MMTVVSIALTVARRLVQYTARRGSRKDIEMQHPVKSSLNSQMRLECDGYICQKCHRTIDESELHCHHITGVEQNPIESADIETA